MGSFWARTSLSNNNLIDRKVAIKLCKNKHGDEITPIFTEFFLNTYNVLITNWMKFENFVNTPSF